MNCFILTWQPNTRRQEILDALDKIPEVLNWRASTGAIFIISNLDAVTLSKKINTSVGKDLFFVINPISIDTIEGFTDRDTWNFIRKPRRAGEPYN